MKKLILVGLISGVFSVGAFAACPTGNGGGAQAAGSATAPATGEQCVCAGGAAVKSTINGGSGTVIPITAVIFIKSGFDVQCSSNTIVSYNEVSGTGFAVGAGSTKGNQTVMGASNGGAVTTSGKCPATGCAAGDVTTATAAGAALASGT